MKIRPVGPNCSRQTDGQTAIAKLSAISPTRPKTASWVHHV